MNTTKNYIIKPERRSSVGDRAPELVIIDTHVDRWELLAAGVRPDCDVVVLHPQEDGIEQISKILHIPLPGGVRGGSLNPPPLQALHIISHGAPGTLFLGNSILNSETLQTRYSKEIQQWRHALAEDAHILIYGCNVAAPTPYIPLLGGVRGGSTPSTPQLLKQLQQLTGAEISASTTAIGSATKGGNWHLDVSTAKVAPLLALQRSVMADYDSILSVQFEWGKAIGSSNPDKGTGIATNSFGEILVTGEYQTAIAFDEYGNDRLTNDNHNALYGTEAYLARFYSDGDYAYYQHAESLSDNSNNTYDSSSVIVADSSDNFFIAGHFYDGQNQSHSYLVKRSNLNNFDNFNNWEKEFYSNNGTSKSRGIATDSNGNVFVTGLFQGAIDFDGNYPDDIINHNYDGDKNNAYLVTFDSSGNYLWAKSFGDENNNNTFSEGQGVATDSNGNVVATGVFQGPIDFDGDGTVEIGQNSNDYERDVYLVKFDSNGTLVWEKSFGDGGFLDSQRGIGTDSDGNIFLTGMFQGAIDFDGDGRAELGDNYDPSKRHGYLAKFDSNGDYLWAKGFQSSDSNSSDRIAIDSSGNVYVAGQFIKEIDFNADANPDLIVNKGYMDIDEDDNYEEIGDRQRDAYVAKFDNNNGDLIWAQAIGSSKNNSISDITIDNNGDLLISGEYENYIQFNQDDDSIARGSEDPYIAKLDSSDGNLAWSQVFLSSDLDSNRQEIATDSSGNFFLTGGFQGSLDLDGDGTPEAIGHPNDDAYLAKFDSSGNVVWAKSFSGTQDRYGAGVASSNAIATDSNGNVLVSGKFKGEIDLDGDYDIDLYNGNGEDVSYVAKFDSSGEVDWANYFSSNNSYSIDAIASDATGNVLVAGTFQRDLSFNNPNIYLHGNNNLGNYWDTSYVAQLNSSGEVVWAKSFDGESRSQYTEANHSMVGIASDSSGNFFVAGMFQGELDIDGDGNFDLSNDTFNEYHVYLAKFDSSGNYLWAKSFGQQRDDVFLDSQGIATDSTGNVFLTGQFKDYIDFDDTTNGSELYGGDRERSAYVVKFDSSGNYVWAKGFKNESDNPGFSDGQSITVDNNGLDIFVTGEFSGNFDLDGDGNFDLSNNGSAETYVAKFDNSGNLIEAQALGTDGHSSGAAIAIDSNGDALVAGQFSSHIDFDRDNVAELSANYTDSTYVAKLSFDHAPTSADTSIEVNEDSSYTFSEADFPIADNNGQTLQSVMITRPMHGELELNGASVSSGQVISVADLSNLTYTPAPDFYTNIPNVSPYFYQTDDRFQFKVNNGNEESTYEYTLTAIVNPVNDAPTLETVNVFGNEDSDIVFREWNFSEAFSDVDSDSLSKIKITSLPDNATLKLDGTAVTVDQEIAAADIDLTFTPDANFNGTTSFSWNGFDGSVYADTNATVNLTVRSVNDLPTISTVSKSGNEDTDITFAESDFTAAFTDAVENDNLSKIKITSLSANGTLKLSGTAVTANQEIAAADIGNLTFTPDANFNGTTSFSWNGSDGSDYATANATVDLTVNPVNDAAILSTVSKSGNENTDISFAESDFTAAFTDAVENDNLSKIKITSLPDNGTLKLNGTAVTVDQEIAAADIGNLTFTPDANFIGTTSFTWNGFDGSDYATADAEVVVAVAVVNDPPILSNVNLSGQEDSEITFTESDFTDAFTDVDSLSKIKITSLPDNGTLKLNETAVAVNQEIDASDLGNLSFTPDENYNGTTSFSWNGFDGIVYADTDATVNLNVAAVNDRPTLSDLSKTGNEDTDITFTESDFTAAFEDLVEQDSLSQIKITSLPDNGTLKLNGTAVTVNQEIAAADIGNLTFTPNANFNGTTSFTWNGSDGSDYADAVATVSLNVGALNDAPSFTATNPDAVDEDAGSQTVNNWATFSPGGGSDEANQTATYYSVENVSNSALFTVAPTVDADGTLRYTPADNANGSSTFDVAVLDNGGTGNGGVNRSAAETFTITVNSVEDIPTLNNIGKTANEDTDIIFALSDFTAAFNDADGNNLSQIKITSLPANGILKLNDTAVTVDQEIAADRLDNLTFTNVAHFNGTTSFTWNGFDGTDYADAVAIVNLTVNALNDAPSFTATNPDAVDEDAGAQTVNNWASFSPGGGSDEATQTATNYSVENVSNSALFAVAPKVDADGTLRYTPADNANGSSTFDVSVLDNGGTGNGGVNRSGAETFTITVNSVEDIPTLSDFNKLGNPETDITFTESDFAAAFSDEDGESLSQIKITSLPANGTLKLNDVAVTVNQEIDANQLNNLTFTADANFEGNTSFTWNGSDGKVYADADATVSLLDITATNSPPTVNFSDFIQELSFANTGNFWEFQLTFPEDFFIDPDPGQSLTYSATLSDGTLLPDWLNFDSDTRTFSGINRQSQWIPITVTATDPFGESASYTRLFEFSKFGVAIDGYIEGGTVFFDANFNGVQDANEPFTTSDANGFYDLDIPLDTFDTNNNGLIDNAEGNIVVFGGTDTATGLPLETPLSAPADGTVTTLLTSLVADLTNQGLTTEEANQQVVSSLGLANVDVTTLDPIAATNNNLSGGLETLTAMTQVQNAVTQITKLISGATTTDDRLIVRNVIAAFTSQIQTGSTIDVSNSTQLTEIIGQAATATQQSDPNIDLPHLEAIATDAATVIAAANQQIDQIVSSSSANSEQLQFEIAQVQFVALGETSQDLQQAGNKSKPISDVVAENTGAALEDQIQVALSSTPEPTDSTEAIEEENTGTALEDQIQADLTSSEDTSASQETTSDGGSESDSVLPVGPAPSFAQVNLEFVLETEETEEGTDSDDTLTGDSGKDIFLAHSGNDRLNGFDGNDWMNGNRGQDTLNGGLGDDTLYGGKDNDILNGDDGDDVAFGNWGLDFLTGGNGNDFLNGNQENDTLDGGLGDDTLHGGKNNDSLVGGEGDDLLSGDLGNDTIAGGNGQDIFALKLGHGSDEILDFINGTDRIGLSGGLTFGDLTITGSNGNTLISSNNELLATLAGVDVSSISSADFTLLG